LWSKSLDRHNCAFGRTYRAGFAAVLLASASLSCRRIDWPTRLHRDRPRRCTRFRLAHRAQVRLPRLRYRAGRPSRRDRHCRAVPQGRHQPESVLRLVEGVPGGRQEALAVRRTLDLTRRWSAHLVKSPGATRFARALLVPSVWENHDFRLGFMRVSGCVFHDPVPTPWPGLLT